MIWDKADFAVMGALLFGACSACELAVRATGSVAYRAAVGIAVTAAFILIWMNLVVGIIGPEDNPTNLMFGGVLAVGIVGALIMRFRPRNMARVLVATALTQAPVGVIALPGATWANWPAAVMIPTSFFTAL